MRKHNPRKRYGPQMDVWCSFAIGAVIVSHVISAGQSEYDSFMYCLLLLTGAITIENACNSALQLSTICLDRGYSGIKNTILAAKAGLSLN